jgi:hypothetical protein
MYNGREQRTSVDFDGGGSFSLDGGRTKNTTESPIRD